MYFKKYSLLILAISCLSLNAQVKISKEELVKAEELKTKYSEASSVINESEMKFEFRYFKGKPQIINTVSNSFISLRLNHSLKLVYNYDDYSTLKRATLIKHKGQYGYMSPVCGTVMVDDIFYHDMKFCGYQFDFESVGERSTFKLVKEFNDVKYLTNFYFNEEFPIVNRKVEIIVPKWMELELREYNFDGYDIKKSEVKQSDGSVKITYKISDMEAAQKEPLSRGRAFVYPHILFMFKGYEQNGSKKDIIRTKDDLYAWYSSLLDGNETASGKLKEFTSELIEGCSTENEKIKSIYYWVQDNIRYIAFENGLAGFKPEAAEKVFNNKYGDCKGMANLLKAMLKSVDVDARLTWLGTNSIMYDYSVPTLSSDNHVICTVITNGEKLYLDATEKYSSIGNVAERIQGRQVLIEDGEKYIFDSIPKLDYLVNEYKRELNLEIEEDKLIGNARFTVSGEKKVSALSIYHSSETEDKEDTFKNIFRSNENVYFKEIDFKNQNNRDSSLVVNATLEIENEISEFNSEYYISTGFFWVRNLLRIDEKRKGDIFFNEKINNHSLIKIRLPKGVKTKYLPESVNIDNEFFKCMLNYKEVDGAVVIERQLIIPKGFIPIDKKEEWNVLQKQLKNHSKEQVILKNYL